jgi:hypothetical protein
MTTPSASVEWVITVVSASGISLPIRGASIQDREVAGTGVAGTLDASAVAAPRLVARASAAMASGDRLPPAVPDLCHRGSLTGRWRSWSA